MLKRTWAAAFGLFFALAAAWAVATPLGAAPDEPAHMVRAAAVSSGQITGPKVLSPVPMGGVQSRLVSQQVRVPKSVAALADEVTCYKFQPQRPASCTGKLKSSSAEVRATTYAGVYNPTYYLLVGWPIHLVAGKAGMYLMRLASAALCAALLASAAAIARGIGRIAFAGVFAAATPMALFLAGVVNPNSVEAAAGLLAWTALGALALDRRSEAATTRLAFFVVGAAVLVTVRSTGLEWLIMMLCVAAVFTRRQAAAELLGQKPVRLWLAALGACIVLAEVWNHVYGGLNLVPFGDHTGLSVTQSISASVHTLPQYTQELIGKLGWLDTPAPLGTLVVWLVVFGALALAAILFASRRVAVAVLILLVGVVAIPIAANAVEAGGLGNLWQGRYLLWWAAGLPVISTMGLATSARQLPAPLMRRLPVVTVLVLAAGHLGMWWVSARRYGVGLDGPLLPLHSAWRPPGGWIPCSLLFALGLVAAVILAWPPRTAASEDSATAPALMTRPRHPQEESAGAESRPTIG